MDPYQDSSAALSKKEINFILSVIGKILYYASSLDPTMLCDINEVPQVQYKQTHDTLKKSRMLLDYAATYPNAIIFYNSSQILLHVNSDAAYLVMTEVHGWYEEHFYLSDRRRNRPHKPTPRRNGPILMTCKSIFNIVTSAAESETIGRFNNAKAGVGSRPSLF